MRFLLLLSLAIAGLAGFARAAEEAPLSLEERQRERDEYAERQIGERVLRNYPAAPAKEALSPDVYDHYREALERGECKSVLPLLFDAYIKRYPELKDAFEVFDVQFAWRVSVVREANPDYAFCEGKKALEEELARLRERGIELAPYGGKYTIPTSPPAAVERNDRLFMIEMLASREYVPAMHYFLRLESDPKLLRMAPDQRIYLLHRLKLLGAPLPDQEAREAAAAAALPPDRVRKLRCWAEKAPDESFEAFVACYGNKGG